MSTYPQAPMGGTTTVVITTPVFGDAPVQTVCTNCRNTVVTSVSRENGTCTYIWCFAVFLVCCPCFWIPFVTDCAKDVKHTCPSCGVLLGLNKR